MTDGFKKAEKPKKPEVAPTENWAAQHVGRLSIAARCRDRSPDEPGHDDKGNGQPVRRLV